MTRSLAAAHEIHDIDDKARTLAPTQSISILRHRLLGVQERIAAATEIRDHLLATIARLEPLVGAGEAPADPGAYAGDEADEADAAAEGAEAASDDEGFKMTRREFVLDLFERHGPGTTQMTVDRFNAEGTHGQIDYSTIYNLMHNGRNSMRQIGEIEADPDHPGARPAWFRAAPRKPGFDLEIYLAKILGEHNKLHRGKQGVRADDILTQEFAEIVGRYVEEVLWRKHNGRRVHPGYTYKSVRNNGVIGAISQMVMSQSDGFSALVQAGYPELTVEALVLKHRHRFTDPVVEAAQAALGKKAD